MNISTSGLNSLNSAQVALRLIDLSKNSTDTSAAKPQNVGSADSDISALLAYRDAALEAIAATAAPTAYDPADSLPEGWSMGELVSIDTLEPEYRDYAKSLGATHVRLYGADEVDDATFTAMATAALDEWYGEDASYQAAKAAGAVTIERTSDVMASLGDSRAGQQFMALYRAGGSEYFGSGGTGITSEAYSTWWQDQNAAGRFVVPGGTMGQNFTASWDML